LVAVVPEEVSAVTVMVKLEPAGEEVVEALSASELAELVELPA